MFTNNVEVLHMTRAMARHAAARQGVIARNVANADTPGYRARDLPSFADVWRGSPGGMRTTRAAHLGQRNMVPVQPQLELRNAGPNGNSVSLEAEMVKAAEARQAHDLALAVHRSLSGNIRTALGRK